MSKVEKESSKKEERARPPRKNQNYREDGGFIWILIVIVLTIHEIDYPFTVISLELSLSSLTTTIPEYAWTFWKNYGTLVMLAPRKNQSDHSKSTEETQYSRKWKRYELPEKLSAEWARGPVGKKSVPLPHISAFGRAASDESCCARIPGGQRLS